MIDIGHDPSTRKITSEGPGVVSWRCKDQGLEDLGYLFLMFEEAAMLAQAHVLSLHIHSDSIYDMDSKCIHEKLEFRWVP